jgi:regulatory protein
MLRRRSSRPPREERGTDAGTARTAATALLARRDFTSAELHARLCAQGFEDVSAAEVVTELEREGVVNGERYAQNYVAYHAGRGQGPLRIAAELRRRGLAAEIVEAALAGGPDWRAVAIRVCRAKFGPQLPSSWPLKARQARFLQSRGFSADHIRAATGADPDSGLTDL